MNISSSRAFGNARKALIGLLLVGASCVSSQASAALVLFNLTGAATASFTLDQSPTPAQVSPHSFAMNHVVGTFLGTPSSDLNLFFNDSGDLNIDNLIDVGGILNVYTVFFSGNTAPLFSNTTAIPKFNLGTYSFHVFASQPNLGGDATLTITSVTDAVPEPSTWMMMLVGFGLLGGAMRYGRKANAGTQTASLA